MLTSPASAASLLAPSPGPAHSHGTAHAPAPHTCLLGHGTAPPTLFIHNINIKIQTECFVLQVLPTYAL